MKRIIITLTVALALSSCSVFKKYSRPESISTDSLFGKEVITTDTTSIADIGWRDFFTDPHLQALIETGLKNNADMRIAAQRVTEAQAAMRTARLAFLPSFAFSPSFSTSSNIGQSSSYSYSLPITAGWEIDIAGRTLNNKRKAVAAYEQSKLYRRSVQTSLISSIANCYYTLLMLDAQQEISRTTAASGVSPDSTLPPGNSQPPACSPWPRCVANTCPSERMMAATTLTVFISSPSPASS